MTTESVLVLGLLLLVALGVSTLGILAYIGMVAHLRLKAIRPRFLALELLNEHLVYVSNWVACAACGIALPKDYTALHHVSSKTGEYFSAHLGCRVKAREIWERQLGEYAKVERVATPPTPKG